MAPEVMISHLISEEEWERTAALRWDEDTFPLYHCFFGLVSVTVRGQEVLGKGEFDMSVADLAVGLSELLEKLRNSGSGTFEFQQSDDSLQLKFAVEKQEITISSNLLPGQEWKCSKEGLAAAIEEFARTFANEVVIRVPLPFEWRDMKILERAASSAARLGLSEPRE